MGIWRAMQGGLGDATKAELNILEQLDGDDQTLRRESWWEDMRGLAANAYLDKPMWTRGADFEEGLAKVKTADARIGCVYLIVGFKDGRLALTYVGRTGDKFARIGSYPCAMSLVAQGIKKKPALVYEELAQCDRCLIFPLLKHTEDSTSEGKRTTRAVVEGKWCSQGRVGERWRNRRGYMVQQHVPTAPTRRQIFHRRRQCPRERTCPTRCEGAEAPRDCGATSRWVQASLSARSDGPGRQPMNRRQWRHPLRGRTQGPQAG
ncbi:hypothetical protein BDZ90DRAFT_229288 [Jaminaea rosea]|uniref:Uncharacterized protein n=1 Tax=Jaminaea rosea TaxID=1569628 RepID=A0A316UY88_9BASI|nr:hypothetical protein BDZ90DRAFT_229288 [Jaminaea rosea]PWN30276.1 hypothetical protein BDZ90DRAFT_229288 [Jaminaea rosea]